MDQTDLALNNLATATAEGIQTVANVTTVNKPTIVQLTKVIESLTTIQARLSTLENRIGNQEGNGGHNHPRPNNRDNESYCFSHGHTHMNDHTSGTCHNPIEGHKATSMLSNRQGGRNCYCGNNN